MANPTPNFESVLRQFEVAWRGAAKPHIADFLPVDAEASLLVELALVDMEYRIRDGAKQCVEDYVRDFPALSAPEVLLDFIISEYQLRTRHQQAPSLSEYHARFPHMQAQLAALANAQQWDAHAHTVREVRPGVAIWQRPAIPDIVLGSELGRGGMGVVYCGEEPALNRQVAVKTLLHYPDADIVARFRREAETIARLDHSNIVRIHRVGTWEARGTPIPYFVMPYYATGHLTREAGDVRMQVIWLMHIAHAVQHAHERGILHRDLKPSNILLDEQQQAYVTDFGLAGWFDTERTHEFTNVVVGTPAYMAPEQARDPARVTTAVDVYGLGGILYYQLTGQPPFVGDTPLATLRMVEEQPPTPPSKLVPDVPRDLEIICLKCLAKAPTERYASPAELANDLQAWLDGRPIAARSATNLERAWRLARRHPYVSLLATSTMTSLLFAVVVLLVANASIRQKEADATQARNDLHDLYVKQQRSLYIEQVAAAGRLYQANSIAHAWYLLDQCPQDERFWEWHYLDQLRHAPSIVLHHAGQTVRSVALLADDSPVTLDDAGIVRWWTTSGTVQRQWKIPPANAMKLLAHPKELQVVVATSTGAHVIACAAPGIQRMLPCDGVGVIHPEGTHIYLSAKETMQAYDLGTGQSVGKAVATEGTPLCGLFVKNGTRLIVGTTNRLVVAWDIAKGERLGTPWRRLKAVFGLQVTRDGQTLLESMPSLVRMTDLETGRLLRLTDDVPGRPVLVPGPGISSYYSATPTFALQLHDVDETRLARRSYRGHTAYITSAAARSRFVLTGSADGTARLYDTKQTAEAREFGAVNPMPHTMQISSDGQQLVVMPTTPTSKNPHMSLFDVATGKERVRIPAWGSAVFGPPDTLFVSERTTLKKWDMATEATTTLEVKQSITRLAYDAARNEVFVGDLRGTLQFINATTMQPTGETLELGSTIYALELRGDLLLVCAREVIELHDRRTRERLFRHSPTTLVRTAALAPDGQKLAFVSGNQTFALLNIADGSQLPFIGAPGDLHAVAFHPSGRRLATAGADGRVRVWDTETRRELLTLESGYRDAFAVTWSPDGKELFALGATVRVWRGD